MADEAVPTLDTGGDATIAPALPGPAAPAQPPAPAPTMADMGGSGPAPAAPGPNADDAAVRGPSIGARALHGVMAALGGTEDTVYTPGPDGKLVQSTVPLGPGQGFKRIIAGALAGVAASGQAGSGPGAAARGLSLGIAGGYQQAQQVDQRKQQMAQQDFENQQKQKVQQAQTSLLGQQTLRAAFDLSRAKIDATANDVDRFNQFEAKVQNTPGARDLGAITMDAGDADYSDALHRFVGKNPELIKDFAQGNIGLLPNVVNGKVDGVRAAVFPQQWLDKPTTEDTHWTSFEKPEKPGDPPKEVQHTIPAGAISNRDSVKYTMDSSNKSAEYGMQVYTQGQENQRQQWKDAAEILGKRIEAGGDTERAMIAAGMAGNAQGGDDGQGNTVEQAAQLLVQHKEAPSQLSNRSGMKQAIINRANQLSLQQTGQGYDPEEGEAQYKARVKLIGDFTGEGVNATSLKSFNTFLGHALMASNAVNDARNGGVPWLNTPINKIKVAAGSASSPAYQAFNTELAAAKKEWATFLENGHALTESDKQFADKLADPNATPAQLQAVLKSMADTAQVRLGSMNAQYYAGTGKDAPYLLTENGAQALKHFGIDPRGVYQRPTQAYAPGAQQGGGQQPQQPQTPGPNSHVFSTSAWAKANPGKDASQAANAARAQGYQVTQ